MKRINRKSIPIIFFVILLFLISFIYRKNKQADIAANSKYAIAKITKQLSSLKNGHQWYYEFVYKKNVYEWYRSTHVGYDIKIGDYFLVQFSSKNPGHSKIFYEYQLKPDKLEYINYVWDTIPKSILKYRKKQDRFW